MGDAESIFEGFAGSGDRFGRGGGIGARGDTTVRGERLDSDLVGAPHPQRVTTRATGCSVIALRSPHTRETALPGISGSTGAKQALYGD